MSDVNPQIASPNGSQPAGSCLTRLEIAELACKVIALWVFTQVAFTTVPFLLFILAAIFQPNPGKTILVTLGISAVVPLGGLIIGIFLWKKSRAVARRMVSEDPSPVIRTDFGKEHLLSIAFTVVGIYAVWESMNGLFRIITQIFLFTREYGLMDSGLWKDIKWEASVCGTLGSLGFGIWLLLGSRGIVRLLQRIRGDHGPPDGDPADNIPVGQAPRA